MESKSHLTVMTDSTEPEYSYQEDCHGLDL